MPTTVNTWNWSCKGTQRYWPTEVVPSSTRRQRKHTSDLFGKLAALDRVICWYSSLNHLLTAVWLPLWAESLLTNQGPCPHPHYYLKDEHTLYKISTTTQVWWSIPVISVLRKLKQEDCHELVTQQDLVIKTAMKENEAKQSKTLQHTGKDAASPFPLTYLETVPCPQVAAHSSVDYPAV